MTGGTFLEISLQELAAALEKTDVLQGYVDTRDGRVLVLEEAASAAQSAECEAAYTERLLAVEEDWQRYVPLPNIYEEEIRTIMQAFAASAPSEAGGALTEALSGGAARLRFRRAVKALSLEAAWHAHLRASLLTLARDWCEENAVAYRD